MSANVIAKASDEVDFITRQEAATLLRVDVRTIDNYIANGLIKGLRMGRKKLFSKSQVLESLKVIPARVEADAV